MGAWRGTIGSKCLEDVICGYNDLFSFAEMGREDLKTFVLEVTWQSTSPSLDIVTFSKGTTAVLYGLATVEE